MIAKFSNWKYLIVMLASMSLVIACGDDNNDDNGNDPSSEDFIDLLTNQVDQVITSSMLTYQEAATNLATATLALRNDLSEGNLTDTRVSYQVAYLAYQAVAVHNYFDTENSGLVINTNLFPVDLDVLITLIESESYNFSTTAQQRANGFPVIDYMLYGTPEGTMNYLNDDPKRLDFLIELTSSISQRADLLVEEWTGDLRENFINNGGTALGSSVSEQLNKSIIYYEEHIRENKVGIPIGLLGPNDSPIPPDGTKIEGYYQSLEEGNSQFALELLRASIAEMEDLYLGSSADGLSNQGYDDLLLVRDQDGIDADIKAQFIAIYNAIDNRTDIEGDDSLYQEIQQLVVLYKSDLFPVLNVQDADGASDGD